MIIAWHMRQTVIKRTTDRALHGRVDRTAYRLQHPSGFRRALHGRVDRNTNSHGFRLIVSRSRPSRGRGLNV